MNREIVASGSRAGPARGVNQDRCAHWRGDDLIIALVADGVGGRQGGEKASWLVVDTFVQHLGVVGLGHRLDRLRKEPPPGPVTVSAHLPGPVQWVEAMLGEANERILDGAAAGTSGMATTVVVSILDLNQRSLHLCHVGDSRGYLYSNGSFSQLTTDHVEYRPDGDRKRAAVTRALGAHLVLPLEITPLARAGYPFAEADVVLLCTDGLCGVVPDERTAAILGQYGEDLSGGVDRMITEVEMLAGSDDASVVLVMPISSATTPSDALAGLTIAPPPPPPRAETAPTAPPEPAPSGLPNLADHLPDVEDMRRTVAGVGVRPAEPPKPVPPPPKPVPPPPKPVPPPPKPVPPPPKPVPPPPKQAPPPKPVRSRAPIKTASPPPPPATPPTSRRDEGGLPNLADHLPDVEEMRRTVAEVGTPAVAATPAETPKPEPKPEPEPKPKPKPRPKPKPKPMPKPKPKPAPEPEPKPEPRPAPRPEPAPAKVEPINVPARDPAPAPPDPPPPAYADSSLEEKIERRQSPLPKILAGAAALLLVIVVVVFAVVAALVISGSRDKTHIREPLEMTRRPTPEGGAPAWIDDTGDEFVIGHGTCPASAVCLAEAGLGDVDALALLDDQPTSASSSRQLRTYVTCAGFLQDAGGVLGHWRPSEAVEPPGSCLQLFPGDRPWTVGLDGSPSPLVLPGDGESVGHYRMSSFARDIVVAVAEGARSWNLLMDGQPDPLADTYRVRLAAGMELALASGSLDDIDRLPEAVGAALQGGNSMTLRLPSDPMVAFDGAGPFAIGSAFRRELNALADLSVRRGSIHYELCMVDQDYETKARPDAGAWNAARRGYLLEALREASHDDHLDVCAAGVTIEDAPPVGDDDPCDPYREALPTQTLLLISSDLL